MSGLDGLVNSRQAADMLGLARADDAWRAVGKYAGRFPGRVEIIQIGTAYAARRSEMLAFAAWYNSNVGRARARKKTAARTEVPQETADRDPLTERRLALRAAIGRIVGKQESL